MLLFKLADLPRSVHRLARPLPLGPDRSSAPGQTVSWALAPALLDPREVRTRTMVEHLLALYVGAVGRPRASLDRLRDDVEDVAGDYRLGRCLARAIEALGYHFAPPTTALAEEAVSLRTLCYRRVQEVYGGIVPAAERAAFLAGIAADLGVTPADLETALWADRAGAALLTAGQAADRAPFDDAERALSPEWIIAAYNGAAVATVLAAASWVTLRVPAAQTGALKDLYRHARAAHVGVEIAVPGRDPDLLQVTLYGPGSRALVRGRTVQSDTAGAPPHDDQPGEAGDDGESDALGGATAISTPRTIPAPGGAPVAAVIARLVRRHPAVVRGGWARVLGVDQRLFHVGLDDALIAALRPDPAMDATGTDPAEDEALSYDSAVEESFARAWLAQDAHGRLSVVHGWVLRREPRAIAVAGTVFIPDFTFSRGETEVYAEIVGFYTDDYLTRKRHKLTALSGQLRLLLLIEENLAPLFADVGYPVITYKTGHAIRMTEVVRVLDTHFDPFTQRKEEARAALAALCAVDGPAIDEADLCEQVNCGGLSDLAGLWADVAQDVGHQAGVRPQGRRYIPGYGLVSQRRLVEAQAALHRKLDEREGPLALEDALACCRQAGIVSPDEGLLLHLGVKVVHNGLFGEARVYRPGDDAVHEEQVESAVVSAPPKSRPAAQRHRARTAPTNEADTLDIGLFATEPAIP